MSDKFQLRLWVLLVSAVVALGFWKWIPGTSVDRVLFSTVASGSSNGALFISGEGSHPDPWKLRAFSAVMKADHREAPVIVSLGDDLQGFFQTSPPAPIDLAVILTNFQRLGAKKAATAAVFAWEKPDPIGLAAFEKSLAGFESLVMAVPLSRGVVPTPMPPALRRTSIPAEKVHGDVSKLPVVNRIPIPGVILGAGDTVIAGFSVLEPEPSARLVPLLARWEDRLVFSFPLLTVLQRLDLPLAGVEVRLGEYLKLGPAGPLVPVDAFGRLAMSLKPISGYAELSAEALIDGGDELFPKQAPDPVILRDDQTAAEPATREFSRNLSATIALIAANGGLTDAVEYPRLSESWEIALLALAVLVMTALCGASRFVRCLGALVLAGIFVAGQWIAFGTASVWLPGMSVLALIGSAALVVLLRGKIFRKPAPAPAPVMPPAAIQVPEIMTVEEHVPEPVAVTEIPVESKPKPTARKTAAKKTAAKKTAAKKTAPRKTATKKTAAKKTTAKKAAKPKSPPEDP